MDQFKAEHDKLFDEICNKLKELSHHSEPISMDSSEHQKYNQNQKFEKMQNQIQRFQNDLVNVQDNLLEKMKSMASLQHHQVDLSQQLKIFQDQLQAERQINVKLNTDLSKTLEINLQLQLELQSARGRFQQYQMDEKKYINSLLEKNQAIQKDLELTTALKDEVQLELTKAHNQWEVDSSRYHQQIETKKERITEIEKENSQFRMQVQELNSEMEKMAESLNNLEDYRRQQNDALKNLMDAAEKKIEDYKLALEKKSVEAQDYYGHLQQAMTQMSLLRNENSQLRDYIQRLSATLQGQNAQALQQMPTHVGQQTQGMSGMAHGSPVQSQASQAQAAHLAQAAQAQQNVQTTSSNAHAQAQAALVNQAQATFGATATPANYGGILHAQSLQNKELPGKHR